MTAVQQSPVLLITRGLILFIMGLLVFAGLILALVAVVLPFYWSEAAHAFTAETPGLDTATLYRWIYVLFAFGMITIGLLWAIMRKLRAIVRSVALGNPFAIANAARLKSIGWLMVAAQLVAIPLAMAAKQGADLFGKNDVSYDFPLNGILSILLVFVLAGVFEQGARMREELEGTV